MIHGIVRNSRDFRLVKVKTPLLHVDFANPDPATLEVVAEQLKAGKIIIYPTDTIYGLGCDAFNAATVGRLNRLKTREPGNPLLILIPGLSWVSRLAAEVPDAFELVADAFWPGPLTIILKASDEIPREVCGQGDTIGLRWARSQFLDGVMSILNRPIISTSANLAGHPPLLEPAVESNPIMECADFVVDAGRLSGRASTLLDLSGAQPAILREGAISRRALKAVLPTL